MAVLLSRPYERTRIRDQDLNIWSCDQDTSHYLALQTMIKRLHSTLSVRTANDKMNSPETCIHWSATLFLPLSLPNADQFSKLFHRQTIPQSVTFVATLPCEMSVLKNGLAPELSYAKVRRFHEQAGQADTSAVLLHTSIYLSWLLTALSKPTETQVY